MAVWTKHISGALTNGMQHCVLCGKVLSDYRNTATIQSSTPLRGWPEGAVYVYSNISTTLEPTDEKIKPCTKN